MNTLQVYNINISFLNSYNLSIVKQNLFQICSYFTKVKLNKVDNSIMGKLNGLILVFLLSLSTVLLSDDVYINVTNVKSKKQLNYPYKMLKLMGFKMSYKQKSYGYAVYVGPYNSKASLSKAYKKIKYNFENARIIVHKSKPEIIKSNIEKQEVEKPKKTSKKHNGYIIGAGVGYANAPSTHSIINGTVIISEPNSSGINYTVFGGYNFNNNISLLLNYMHLYADDLEFHNYYSSINYKFSSVLNINPYFGVSVGYSELKWNTSPIPLLNASPTSGNDSSDIMYGTQVGFNYKLFNNISFKMDYSCLFLNHATNIILDSSNSSKLQHNTLHSLLFGIEYNF